MLLYDGTYQKKKKVKLYDGCYIFFGNEFCLTELSYLLLQGFFSYLLSEKQLVLLNCLSEKQFMFSFKHI